MLHNDLYMTRDDSSDPTIGSVALAPPAVSSRITFTSDPAATNTLHGSNGWFADFFTDSDRRLKSNIEPLGVHLQRNRERMFEPQPSTGADRLSSSSSSKAKESAVSWMLRQLRPVSFNFKKATDAKPVSERQRFGFVAQEVERVAPSLVAKPPKELAGDGALSLMYQDLLAVLALAFKEQQAQLNRQHEDVIDAQNEVYDLLEGAEMLEKVLDKFQAEMEEADEWS